MTQYQWNTLKNERLKRTRGVSFSDIVKSKIVRIIGHPKKKNQKMIIFEYKNYAWLVPCVNAGNYIFLKTIYPSRKYTKILLGERNEEEKN